jgi:chitin disaccharide deacetylase
MEVDRWRPLLGLPSLLDSSGDLYATESDAAAHIDPAQAEAEIRAQIARARAAGIRPTHLDSHMGVLYRNKALFEMLLRVAREEKIPARIWRGQAGAPPGDVIIDRVISIGAGVPPEQWTEWYRDAIRKIEPGVTEIIVHLAHDDAEMRAITADHPNWGAAWRQRDFEFFTSDEFRRLLRENDIQLTTWREVAHIKGY